MRSSFQASEMSRADFLTRVEPHLVADVHMYSTEDGGRAPAALLGWSCPCVVSLERPLVGWDGLPMLGQAALNPGERSQRCFCEYQLTGVCKTKPSRLVKNEWPRPPEPRT